MLNRKNKQGISLVMVVMGLATLLGFAALAIDMGNAFNVQNELQKSTTTAALAGAAAFNPNATASVNFNTIKAAVQSTFDLTKNSESTLASAQIVGNIQVDSKSGAVRFQTKAEAQTYFIGILGIKTLEVNASAGAMNYPSAFKVMNVLTGIPANQQKPTLAFAESLTATGPAVKFYNLPPSRKIQLVCTLPMVNSPGSEISVVEAGNLDGYFVFVSNSPTGPWYNISGTGVSTLAPVGGVSAPGPQLDDPAIPDVFKFYGSGEFDLEGTGMENARYVVILSDNKTDGYLATDYSYQAALPVDPLINENDGCEIDAARIHQHSISITYDDLTKDTNGDGYIDAYDKIMGDFNNPGTRVIDNDDNAAVITAT